MHDVVVWGATGFTGRLVVEYLAEHAPPEVRWAIGGRNSEKLEALRAELPGDVPVVTGDAHDPASMEALAAGTRVVASTVGPYALHGTQLVSACAHAGIDYCDLTGEPQWIRANVDTLHEVARESGARLVHCCGFDSIPSDLGVLLLHRAFEAKGRRLSQARLVVRQMRGGVSGGTVASMLNLMEQTGDSAVRRLIGNPYALNPPGLREGPDRNETLAVSRDPHLGVWTGPFLMAGINTRVVRRSNALLGFPYGRDFRYGEVAEARSRMGALKLTLGIGGLAAIGVGRIGRAAVRRFTPSPGEGPSREQLERGSFHMTLVGHAEGAPEMVLEAQVKGVRDPGYGETAKMLAESALCLAQDELPQEGGVLTPASCLGWSLIERLRGAGMTFEVEA